MDGQGAVLKHVIIIVVIDDITPAPTQEYSLLILGVEGLFVLYVNVFHPHF